MYGTVVISGIGVRQYYEKMNYRLENNFMKKKFILHKSFVHYIVLILLYIVIQTITKSILVL